MSELNTVNRLIRDRYELREIHDGLESWNACEFSSFLDDVLENHDKLFGSADFSTIGQDTLEDFCQRVRSLAKAYVDHPDWRTPWLTDYLLIEVIESQMMYLQWASKWGVYPEWSSRRSLPHPYRLFVPPLVSFLILLLSAGLLFWLIGNDHLVLATVLGLWMFYFYLMERPYLWWSRWRSRKAFRRLANLLLIPLCEIKSLNYDTETIIRRLQDFEQRDLQVASIAFALLKLDRGPSRYAARTS